MAELVDALRSGRSVLLDVEVRVLFWAPSRSLERFFLIQIPSIYNHLQGILRRCCPNWCGGILLHPAYLGVYLGVSWRMHPAYSIVI